MTSTTSLPSTLAADAVTVLAAPVLATGRRELLTVLREQAVSQTLHRFGHLSPAAPADDDGAGDPPGA